jgi:hypothetical protein
MIGIAMFLAQWCVQVRGRVGSPKAFVIPLKAEQDRQAADTFGLNFVDKGLENPSDDQAKQDERTHAEHL